MCQMVIKFLISIKSSPEIIMSSRLTSTTPPPSKCLLKKYPFLCFVNIKILPHIVLINQLYFSNFQFHIELGVYL